MKENGGSYISYLVPSYHLAFTLLPERLEKKREMEEETQILERK